MNKFERWVSVAIFRFVSFLSQRKTEADVSACTCQHAGVCVCVSAEMAHLCRVCSR